MSQVILISDNEIINSLYEVNLRAYVATNVTIKKSLDAAIQLLEHSPNIDAIICFSKINENENSFKKLDEYLSSKSLTIPCIILGECEFDTKKSIMIKNRYDIRLLLKSMAKVLGITAKDMADLTVPEYFPIPLKLFSQVENSYCDIYFRNEKDNFEFDYFKIIEKDAPIGEQVQKYIDEGEEHLYIDAKHRLHFINRASAAVVGELEREDLTNEERIEITQQGMGVVAEEIFLNDEVSETMASVSNACIKSIKKTIKDVPKLKKLLGALLENQTDFCFKHTVITTYIATQLIRNISWGSEEQASKVAFALFFHDIYLIPVFKKYPDAISEEELLFRDDVEDKDKETIINHAKKAGQLIKTFPKCPMGADMMIIQHHGMTSGEGFAVNYKDDISPLSKIMIIAEEVALIVLAKTQGSDNKFELNKEETVQTLHTKFKNHTYRKIINTLSEIKI